jgi:uncharacterized protein
VSLIKRDLQDAAAEALQKYPILAIIGPRQAGKTTFSRMLKPDYQYVNLEDLSLREFAGSDPKGFLETYQGGLIIDEIQNVPALFSYLQVYSDRSQKNGEYIITGSQNFLLMESISQSLAGRVAIFTLLPLSLHELNGSMYATDSWQQYLFQGSYPRRWVNEIPASDYYENYVRTYVERDVRQIKNVSNLPLFQRFLQLLAGRAGQVLNQSSLGNELGIDNKTVESWLSLLEVSFIAFRLQPYHRNFNKRVVKTPKVYFYDTGLLCYLLQMQSVKDLDVHFARGQLFENLVILELLKNKYNKKMRGNFYFWRESSGEEVDLLIDQGTSIKAIEIKSSQTINTSFFKSLRRFSSLHQATEPYLIYGGKEIQKRSEALATGVLDLELIWK